MKKSQFYRIVLLVLLSLSVTFFASAQSVIAYATIVGAKTGNFKGGSRSKGNEGKIECIGFDYSVVSPRDPASGLATGKRMHRPVEIVKFIDGATPQLLQALYSNESLKTVTIEFYKKSPNGQSVLYYRVRLTNATVSQISQAAGTSSGSTKGTPAEHISLVFQKIEIDNLEAKTSAADDWEAVN